MKQILFTILFICIGSSYATEVPKLNKTYENTRFSFRVKYSSKFFKLHEAYMDYTLMEKKVPKVYRGKVYSSANFTVQIENTRTDSLEEKLEEYKTKMRRSRNFENTEFSRIEKVNFAGVDAYLIEGKAKIYTFYGRWKLYLFIYKNRYYEVSGTVQKQRYEELLPIFDSMFASFELLD